MKNKLFEKKLKSLSSKDFKNITAKDEDWKYLGKKIFELNDIEIGKILINEEYPFALIKFSNENFNKDLTLKSKNGSFKIFIPEWLKI